MYRLQFSSYSGMSYPLTDMDDRETVRAEAAHRIMRARNQDRPVVIVRRGTEWEFETPEDAASIGDADGLMWIQHETFACRECGSEHENHGDAMDCCAYDPDHDQQEEDNRIYEQMLDRSLR